MSYLCSRSQFVFLNERISNFVPLVQITYDLKVVSDTSERLLLRLKCVINDVTRFVYGIRRREHISKYVNPLLGVSFNGLIS